MLKKISVFIALIGSLLICSGVFIQYKNEENYFNSTKESYNNLFNEKNDLTENITLSQIIKVEQKIQKINRHKAEKKKLTQGINEVKDYYLLKQEIDKIYPNKILNYGVEYKTINQIDKKYKKLPKKYKKYLELDIIEIKNQKSYIDNVELEISGFFVDNDKTNLKENVTKDQIESTRQKLSLLKQIEFVETKNKELDNAINIINQREKTAISNAWVVLNVPYISQNNNNVFNGCEAASLLVGLQYKGYLQSMTLQQYAHDMPKSPNNNAYEGFTHDIFGFEPRDLPHWIAPGALAAFGRNSSGNQNVVDATGSSLDDLNKEISNNNPVVIYATGFFKSPTEWIEGAPKNIHVLLLTGYNKITKEQIVTDPWTHTNGKTKWYLSKNTLESVYNAVGKKSVIIR